MLSLKTLARKGLILILYFGAALVASIECAARQSEKPNGGAST